MRLLSGFRLNAELSDKVRTFPKKDVLTTGEVAKICHVAPRTVSKWFDRGQLRGYRIPGSRDRRIPMEQLVAFMRANGIPLTGLDGGTRRILIVSEDVPAELMRAAESSGRFDVQLAGNGFEAGVIAQQFRPHAVVLDVSQDESEVVGICRNIKSSAAFGAARVIAACRDWTEQLDRRLKSKGFEACLPMPFTLADLRDVTERLEDQQSDEKGRSWRA
ncbi:MAG TPA: helix-turn-helix domain-containing protein [Phycisphaerae bacterium]|nr:helix-turn-helix domain-containing protein [Phycisphaerae bacterium]